MTHIARPRTPAWVSRLGSPDQMPLGWTRDIRSPEERELDAEFTRAMLEAHVARDPYQPVLERLEIMLADRVDMGLMSRERRDALLRLSRS